DVVAGIDNGRLLERRLMELIPIVEIIEIDSAWVNRAIILQPARAQNALPRVVVVNVAKHSLVMLVNSRLIEPDTRLLFYPGFELRIGRFAIRDKFLYGIRIQSQGI